MVQLRNKIKITRAYTYMYDNFLIKQTILVFN